MDNLSCPHCSSPVLNDRRLAGQVVACPSCKNPFQMPPAVTPAAVTAAPPPPRLASAPPPAPARDDSAFQFDESAAPRGAPATSARAPAAAKPSSSLLTSGEPWFYSFPERYAKLALGAGFALAGLGLVLLILRVVGLVRNNAFELIELGWVLLGLLGLGLVVIGVLFSVAVTLVVVDTARKFREGPRRPDKES